MKGMLCQKKDRVFQNRKPGSNNPLDAYLYSNTHQYGLYLLDITLLNKLTLIVDSDNQTQPDTSAVNQLFWPQLQPLHS